jgi:TolA-binding protein
LLAAQRYEAAEKAFAEFLDKHSAHERAAEAQAQIAVALARQDRAADALQAIERLESRRIGADLDNATRAALQYEKAWCLRKVGRNDEASRAYGKLLDDQAGAGEHVHALLELAEIEAGAGRCEAAVPLLERLRQAAAGDNKPPADVLAAGTYRLAVCEFESGNFERAAALLEEFLDDHPQHELVASASFFCGEACFKSGKHNQAVKHLRRVTESFKQDDVYGPSLLRLGECLAVLQHWERSEQAFSRYLRETESGKFWYQAQFGIGWARENQGRLDEAISAYRPVVERHKGPTAARAQFQLGECLFAQKKYEEAVRELLKVDILYAYPQWSAAALYEAGRCFEHLGRQVEAREQYKTVRNEYGQTRWAEMAAKRLAVVSGGALPGKGGS